MLIFSQHIAGEDGEDHAASQLFVSPLGEYEFTFSLHRSEHYWITT